MKCHLLLQIRADFLSDNESGIATALGACVRNLLSLVGGGREGKEEWGCLLA